MKTKHYIAQMETENFSFVAIGRTEEEAKRAIVKEWNKSPYRKRATVKSLEEYYGFYINALAYGECSYL